MIRTMSGFVIECERCKLGSKLYCQYQKNNWIIHVEQIQAVVSGKKYFIFKLILTNF